MNLDKLFELSCEPFKALAESLEGQGAFEDAARLLSEAPTRPDAKDWAEIQQLAADYLFSKLDEYSNPIDRPETVTAPELKISRQEVDRVKKPLAEIALLFRSKGLVEEAKWLDKAARHWEVEIERDWLSDIVVLPRQGKRHSLEVRGAVWYFADVTNDVFGINMPSIVEKLTGLAVPSVNISKDDVETIVKDYRRLAARKPPLPD
jgi:hypothetical protein